MELISRKSLPSALFSALAADIVKEYGTEGPVRIRRVWVREHPYSCVFRMQFDTDTGVLGVYVKTGNNRQPPIKQLRWAERFENEFEVLRLLWKHFGADRDVGVVRPLGFYADYAALATIECSGERLRRCYRRELSRALKRAAPGATAGYVALAGRWLREFHAITMASREVEFDVDELLEYCEDRLVELRMIGGRSSDNAWASRLLHRVSDAATAQPADHKIAGCHGDFMSHNLFVGEGRIRVLDFTMYDLDSVYYDVCSFWSELELMKLELGKPESAISHLQQVFLEAYGDIDPNASAFQAVQCRYVLTRLLKARQSGWRSPFRLLEETHIARSCYRWLNRFANG